jgi:DNA-binding winged helix-turn-helix (wHTH) protein
VVEPQVFDLLAHLVQHPERVVTKDERLQAVWDGRIVSESAITNRVNAARRAIGDSGEKQRLIRTALPKGFRFIGGIKKEAVDRRRRPCRGFPSPPGRFCRLRRDASDDRETGTPSRRRADLTGCGKTRR